MAHLKSVTDDDLRLYLAEVDDKTAAERLMLALNYKEEVTQDDLSEQYGISKDSVNNCAIDGKSAVSCHSI